MPFNWLRYSSLCLLSRAVNLRQAISTFASCLTIGLYMSLALPLTAWAAGEADFNYGIAYYQRRDYKSAIGFFQRSAQMGCSNPQVWLYLGHCASCLGDRARASQAYRKLVETYPGDPCRAVALASLRRLDPGAAAAVEAANPAPVAPAAGAAVPAASPPAAAVPAAKSTLLSRLVVIKPRAQHPPVSPQTIQTVTAVIKSIPARYMKILDEGGATINVGPNIDDKWPGSGTGPKPGVADTTLGEEGGRTYGRDVHIYERKLLRGTSDLSEPISQQHIAETTMHELGHALDDILQGSVDAHFKEVHSREYEQINEARRFSYFKDPGEAFAEIAAGLMGSTDSSAADLSRALPETTELVRKKINKQ